MNNTANRQRSDEHDDSRTGEAGSGLDVVLISEHNYPSNAAGGRLLSQLCRDLVLKGIRVTAISSALQYTTDFSSTRLPSRESFEGVELERYGPLRFDRRSTVGRTFNELAYSLRVAWRLLMHKRPGIFVVLSSPPFLQPAVALVARLRRVPMVAVVMDVFPDMAAVTGHLRGGTPVYRLWQAVQAVALRSSSRIVVLGRCMRDVIEDRCGDVPVDVVPNWADDDLEPRPRGENRFLAAHPRLNEAVVVMYSGNLGHFHDFETLLAAAEQLRERQDIRFVIIGEGARKRWIEDQVAERGIDNVELLPYQSADMLPHSLSAADIALVTLEAGAEGLCVPSKFYPLLALGRPIVAVMGRQAEVARVVEEARLGAVVAPGDSPALADAIRRLADAPSERYAAGERGCALFEDRYARRYAADRYVDVLYKALGRDRPVSSPRPDRAPRRRILDAPVTRP